MVENALCALADLPDGGARLLVRPGETEPSLVVLRSGETVRAYANRCPHFGIPLAKRQEHLIFQPNVSLSCNNHYARFRWADGVCEFGDCEGEALPVVPITLRNGMVLLNAGADSTGE